MRYSRSELVKWLLAHPKAYPALTLTMPWFDGCPQPNESDALIIELDAQNSARVIGLVKVWGN